MEDFKAITMYQCSYCGKIFKTDHRHHCKFNPAGRNCFSCRYFDKITEVTHTDVMPEYDLPFGGDEDDDDTLKPGETFTWTEHVICCGKCPDRQVSLQTLSARQWQLACPDWEMQEGFTGKDSYVEMLRVKRGV